MPDYDAHAAAVRRNRDLIGHLITARLQENADWIAVVAFYTALHAIEAVFVTVGEGGVRHTWDHDTRPNVLRATNRYSNLLRDYRPLSDAAYIARYLAFGPGILPPPLDPQDVLNVLINHHLAQLIAGAERLTGRPYP